MLSVTYKPFMLSVIMLNVVMLNVVMTSVIVLNVVMMSVIMLNVVMLSVMVPEWCTGRSCGHWFPLKNSKFQKKFL